MYPVPLYTETSFCVQLSVIHKHFHHHERIPVTVILCLSLPLLEVLPLASAHVLCKIAHLFFCKPYIIFSFLSKSEHTDHLPFIFTIISFYDLFYCPRCGGNYRGLLNSIISLLTWLITFVHLCDFNDSRLLYIFSPITVTHFRDIPLVVTVHTPAKSTIS